ncbi:DMT family transporter [Zwartia vadi]|uniref:DMT family transporter n=1 Tax=Zwartia vadi TaxID=3058168 RepID=UPI0025B4E6FF|nr:DMT family transporter [Zwartia vadi]MDN3988836.1 DMT family transporter [Zwartia vadi]
MTFSALLLVIVAAICHASWNLLAKRAAKVGPPFVFAYGLCSTILFAPWVIWILVFEQNEWSWAILGCILLSGSLHLAYSLSLQRGYQVADLSVVYPIARGTGPFLSTIGAILFIREPATVLGLGGMLCVVAGVLMIATQGQIRRLLQPEAMIGVRWGLLVGCLIAAYTLVDAYGVKVLFIAPVLFDWATTASRTVIMLPHMARQPKRNWQAMRGFWPLAWAVGVLSPLGYILVLYALRDGAPVSLVAPAREMSMLLATLAGLYILREPVGWGRLIGCCCIAIGVVMLASS